MTSKERVLQVWPDAYWSSEFGSINRKNEGERLSGPTWWTDEPSAWDDAASRLPVAAPVPNQYLKEPR